MMVIIYRTQKEILWFFFFHLFIEESKIFKISIVISYVGAPQILLEFDLTYY